MPRKLDLTGQRFGSLTAISDTGKRRRSGAVIWLCACDCGNKTEAITAQLRNGAVSSCGCGVVKATTERNTKHGHAARGEKSETYRAWIAMNERCRNPKHISYRYYGGKGIRVCWRWRNYDCFLEDMGEKPYSGWQIDRVDPDGDYRPGNCEWVSASENTRRRNVHYWGQRRLEAYQ